jgi:hypothetical protein
MRTPREIIMTIAYALKEGKKGDEYTLAELSKKTEMHYETTKDYLDTIEYVQRNIPAIEKIDLKGKAKIVITEELKTDLPQEKRMLLIMFDRGSFTKDTAMQGKQFSAKDISSASDRGLIAECGKKIYLTPEGIIESANYADERADRVTKLGREKTNYHVIECVDMEWSLFKSAKVEDLCAVLPATYRDAKEQHMIPLISQSA